MHLAFQAKAFALFLATLILPLSGICQLRLPRIFSDHMVLQREEPINIWGWASPGEKINIQLETASARALADSNGQWKTMLPPQQAGGPFNLIITGETEFLTFEDVLIGEVWLCSGESNMEWNAKNNGLSEEEIKKLENRNIRLFDVPQTVKLQPQADLSGGEWTFCTTEHVQYFSLVGYYFGNELSENLNVPIGLIGSNYGLTEIEAWISKDKLTNMLEFSREMVLLKKGETMNQYYEIQDSFAVKLKNTFGMEEAGLVDGEPLWAAPDLPETELAQWQTMYLPRPWENLGDGYEYLNGIVWYRKTLNLSPAEASNQAILNLGPIDDSDITYVNGKEIGRNINKWKLDRVYKVPASAMKPGLNVISIRVEDYFYRGGFHGKPFQMFLQTSKEKHSLAGEWQFRVPTAELKFDSPIEPNERISSLYHGMIDGLVPYNIKGVIWYHGESNLKRAHQYRKLLPALIKSWRGKWGKEFSFYWVNMPNFNEPDMEPDDGVWAEMRESQSLALKLPSTGQAVTIDLGEAQNIHPKNKLDVAKRLSYLALANDYGKDIPYSGPVMEDVQFAGNKAIIKFDKIYGGLTTKKGTGKVTGFAVKGKRGDKLQWEWAEGIIQGDLVIVTSSFEQIRALRYGWDDNPEKANLYNREGLPATPFRTDEYPGLTKGKN